MTRRVKFIPIRHGDVVDLGDIGLFGVSGKHKYLGFKPGRPKGREGWLVVLVSDGPRASKPRRLVSRSRRRR